MTRRFTTLLIALALIAPLPRAFSAESDKKADDPKDEKKQDDGASSPVVSDEVMKAAAAKGPTTQPTVATGDDRKPHKKPKAGAVYSLLIQELGNFEYDQEKGGNIPKDVEALSGTAVKLTGFMIPLDQADKIRQFVLVPDLFACCFGQPPQVQHSIIVSCPEGKAVSYFPDEIHVEGKLTVQEKKDDGFIVSIFEINCTSVKPAAK